MASDSSLAFTKSMSEKYVAPGNSVVYKRNTKIIHPSGETNPRIKIRRFESFCQFCGRARTFESQSQGFKSLLPGKKNPKLLKIVQIWATFSVDSNFIILKPVFKGIYERSFSFY
jgi:hypothetical protein